MGYDDVCVTRCMTGFSGPSYIWTCGWDNDTQRVDILGNDTDNVPAMLGMSVAYVRQKQGAKARNMLKRICKLDYRPEEAEEFERSWLMLADLCAP